jgi:CSLREA domain-containing protein
MRIPTRALPLGLIVLALLLSAATASAQTYTVTRTDDPVPGACESGDCSLREALMAANGTTTVDDVVVLPASAAPYLIQYEELTLPISDDVEIRGAGADQTVVKGDGKELVFTITGGKTTLVGLTITNGKGAIQNNGAELTLRSVSVEGNERDIDAGGVKSNAALTIESSFIGFNRSDSTTGGGVQSNGAVTIVNSTIAHNFSKGGPGGFGANAKVTLASSAVVSNKSDSTTAAGAAANTLIVRDSIFADNRNSTGLLECFSFNPLSSLGGNVSDDASCGTTATDKPNVDPLLGTLALHGGTTSVYDLLPGSPAIGAAGQCPPVDQRGVTRPQGAACDSGPYEVVLPPVVPTPVGDKELAMGLAKGRLFLNRKDRVRIRLTCPASEASPPCVGKVELRSPLLRTLINGIRDSRDFERYPSARFKLGAGTRKAVVVKVPKKIADLLRDAPKPRKVKVVVQASDAAENAQRIVQRRKIVALLKR